MILTDKNIRSLCIDENNNCIPGALISPFSEESLQSESYDLAIGDRIAILNKEVRCIDITEQSEIDSIYDEKELSKEGYVLSPKEYVLVSLKEDIALPENITAHIRPRTRFTRMGLLVSDQHCNSTYEGNLKIGLYNATNYAIKIFPNVRIAQIVFEELKEIPSEKKLYKNKAVAAYQNEEKFKGGVAAETFDKTISSAIEILLQRKE